MTDTTTDIPDLAVGDDSLVHEVAPVEKINLAELSQSLNGFDQIAIRSRFHERVDVLMDDSLFFTRAMYFIHLRRNGAKDADAFQTAMNVPLSELTDLFVKPEDGDTEESGDAEAIAEAIADRDRDFGEFIMGTGLSYTVEQYTNLTIQQRAAIIEAANKR